MACQDCGMNHAPEDKAACIEGHGDDPDDPRCQGYTAGRKASGRRYYLTPPRPCTAWALRNSRFCRWHQRGGSEMGDDGAPGKTLSRTT